MQCSSYAEEEEVSSKNQFEVHRILEKGHPFEFVI